jgi:glycosyltransferase involved in cell wall biosynthesis
MKKVLIIMQTLVGGGAEKVLVDILKYFDTEEYNVSLYLLFKKGVYLKDIPENIKLLSHRYRGCMFYRLIRKTCRILNLINLYYSIERILFRRFIKTEYDTVISFMEGEPLKYHSFIFDRCKTNISWVHINLNKFHYTSSVFRNNKQEEQIYNKLSYIVFVSNDSMVEFNKLFNVTAPVQKVIYNLIDKNNIISRSKEQDVEKQKFTVCCVGRLGHQKRFDRAINVAKILKDSGFDFELWILGTGLLESELKDLVNSLNLTDCVKFYGFVKNPYPFMKKSDLFLMTSDTEGYSLVVSEALCLGLPVVSTRITGPYEILDNGKYGILTGFEASEIADVLTELMSNPQKLKGLSESAMERSKIFNPENTMSEIYEVIG